MKLQSNVTLEITVSLKEEKIFSVQMMLVILTEIETWVNSSSGYDEYQVRVLLGKNGNIITEDCTCPYFEDNFEPCKHIAAVLLKYIDEDKLSTIGRWYRFEHRHK